MKRKRRRREETEAFGTVVKKKAGRFLFFVFAFVKHLFVCGKRAGGALRGTP